MKINYQKVLELLTEVLEIQNEDIKKIPFDINLEEFGLDSCKALQFFAIAEDDCNITFKYDDLKIENINTINKMLELLNSAIN